MNMKQQVEQNPMTWKDWVTAIGMSLTLGAVVLQGGRMAERLDAANAKLGELTSQLNQIRSDLASADRALETQRGIDRLHEEQLSTLRRDVDAMRKGRP